jgi:amidase
MQKVSGEHVVYAFSPDMTPVLEVESGEIVHFESNDCFYQQVQMESHVLDGIDHDRLNPATGPVYVRGAEPGDLLRVDILAIDVQAQGVAAVVPGEGILSEEAKEAIVRVIPVENGEAVFKGIRLPLRPMIGVIGVAPGDEDGPCPTDTPFRHGGNMDTNEIVKGHTVYFPVRQPGALFALGDCHGLMGDGEICFTGLEIPADVFVRLTVVKNKRAVWPILQTADATQIIASGPTLEAALKDAMKVAVDLLAAAFSLMWEDAYLLASLTVDAKISQVVDPLVTVRASIPKWLVSTEALLAELT